MIRENVPLRHELKYLISVSDYYTLKSILEHSLERDENNAGGGYWVRSLYFDDFNDSALYEKNMGVYQRAKYRIRIYDENESFIRLERKRKYGQKISKEQFVMNKRQYDQLMAGEDAFLMASQNEVAQDFYLKRRMYGLQPKVIVDYQREAYVMHVEDVRITFDKKLSAGTTSFDLFQQPLLHSIMPEERMILEIKYNKFLPAIVRQSLAAINSEAHALSKYLMCREALITRDWRIL